MIASLEDSTIAAYCARISSARVRSSFIYLAETAVCSAQMRVSA